MDELTHILWEYIGKYRLEACYGLTSQREREENEQAAGWNLEDLRRLCPPEALERVGTLMDCLENVRAEDMEAVFTCGLRLGLSLR